MSTIKRNTIIMAAGTASRFVPLSAEIPKGLLEVKGEILIERQIRQLIEAGISDITVVVGYMAEKFEYLKNKFGVSLVLNEDFDRYNNTSSIIRVLDKLANTYICSSDNYFTTNVFIESPENSYYSSLYATGETDEYCLLTDSDDNIVNVNVGGHDSWYMIGHVYFSEDFSSKFKVILKEEYVSPETKAGYWEDVYIRHIDSLPKMKIRRYDENDIKEFDSIDELRTFDTTYIGDTRSSVVKEVANRLNCMESDLDSFKKIPNQGGGLLFSFRKGNEQFCYNQTDNSIVRL